MSHPSEVRIIKPGQRFMGSSVTGEPVYRAPRRGRQPIGTKPMLFDMPAEVVVSQPNIDTFRAGVAFYERPLTSRNMAVAWKGGILSRRQSLTRVLDDEGEHLGQGTERGVFGLYTGIVNVEGSKWFDINKAAKPNKKGFK